MQTKTFVRPDLHLIALDETHQWEIRPQDVPYIEQIVGMYVYNASEHTYCGEMTPSYTLYHVGNQVRLTEAGLALWNAEDPEVDMEELVDFYEMEPTDDDIVYHHVHAIDALVEQYQQAGTQFVYEHVGDPFPKLTDAEYQAYQDDELMENMREHYLANTPF